MPLAYRAHPAITKPAFVEMMQAHREADRIVQGAYWDDGRGCAVGCGVHSCMALAGEEIGHGDHGRLAELLGVDPRLMHLQDRIFEGLPSDEAREWPLALAAAIPEGADLSGVWPQFAARMLRRIKVPDGYPDVAAAVARVAAGWETGWADDDPSAAGSAAASAAESAESAARSAAGSAAGSAAASAAESAESAARSAAWSAWSAARSAAWSAARSAESAESAAWSAAGSAARSAAWSAEYRWMRDELLALVAAAPVVEG